MVATLEHAPSDALATTLGRAQLIERITTFNPTATAAFLENFDDAALTLYLEHLHSKLGDTDRRTPWVRPGDTRAILFREPRDAD